MFANQRTVRVITIVSVLFNCLAQSEIPFNLIFSRGAGNANIITFMCREMARGEFIPGALYFLNGTRLEDFTTLTPGERNEGVTFQMSKELEGYFACGNDSLSMTSNDIPLIG